MSKMLTRDGLLSLEEYHQQRPEIRTNTMAHKKSRNLSVGPNVTLYFEDEITLKYQIQEILRAEKVFDAEGIKDELDTYNAMMPTGTNFKATMMIEYVDATERVAALKQLIGIDKQTWVQVEGYDKVFAISNEDLDRETEDKTSAVHFMRFELTAEMIAAVQNGTNINVGIDHDKYMHSVVPVPENYRQAFANDLS